MTKYNETLTILSSIEKTRAELPLAVSSQAQLDISSRLSNLYACLDVSALKQTVRDMKSIERRSRNRDDAKRAA